MDNQDRPAPEPMKTEAGPYEPPAITYLGSLADRTGEKLTGEADGMTFMGLDIGS